jgi:hypothetical protein
MPAQVKSATSAAAGARAFLAPSRTAIRVSALRDLYFFYPLETPASERVLFRISWLAVGEGKADAWVTPSPTLNVPDDADDITELLRALKSLEPSPTGIVHLPGGSSAVLIPFLSVSNPTAAVLAVDLGGATFSIVCLPSSLEKDDPFPGQNLVVNAQRAARKQAAGASTVLLGSLYFAANHDDPVFRFRTRDSVTSMVRHVLSPHRPPGFFSAPLVRGCDEMPGMLSAENAADWPAGLFPSPSDGTRYGNGKPDPHNQCSLQQAAATGHVDLDVRVPASGSTPAVQGGLLFFGPGATGTPIAIGRLCTGADGVSVDIDARHIAAVERRTLPSPLSASPSPSSSPPSSPPATPLTSCIYSLAIYLIRGSVLIERHDAGGSGAAGKWTLLGGLDEENVRIASAHVRLGARWRVRAYSTSASVAISIVLHAGLGSTPLGGPPGRPVDPSCVHLEACAAAADEPAVPGSTSSALLMSCRFSGRTADFPTAGSETVQGIFVRPIHVPGACPAGTAACFPTIYVLYAPGEARPSSLRRQQPPLVAPKSGWPHVGHVDLRDLPDMARASLLIANTGTSVGGDGYVLIAANDRDTAAAVHKQSWCFTRLHPQAGDPLLHPLSPVDSNGPRVVAIRGAPLGPGSGSVLRGPDVRLAFVDAVPAEVVVIFRPEGFAPRMAPEAERPSRASPRPREHRSPGAFSEHVGLFPFEEVNATTTETALLKTGVLAAGQVLGAGPRPGSASASVSASAAAAATRAPSASVSLTGLSVLNATADPRTVADAAAALAAACRLKKQQGSSAVPGEGYVLGALEDGTGLQRLPDAGHVLVTSAATSAPDRTAGSAAGGELLLLRVAADAASAPSAPTSAAASRALPPAAAALPRSRKRARDTGPPPVSSPASPLRSPLADACNGGWLADAIYSIMYSMPSEIDLVKRGPATSRETASSFLFGAIWDRNMQRRCALVAAMRRTFIMEYVTEFLVPSLMHAGRSWAELDPTSARKNEALLARLPWGLASLSPWWSTAEVNINVPTASHLDDSDHPESAACVMWMHARGGKAGESRGGVGASRAGAGGVGGAGAGAGAAASSSSSSSPPHPLVRGGALFIPGLGLVVEARPGDFVVFPGSRLLHGNLGMYRAWAGGGEGARIAIVAFIPKELVEKGGKGMTG